MSVDAFDLGQRLRAAATGQPSDRARYAPVLPPTAPVAVTLTGSGDAAVLRAATSTAAATGHGRQALAALTALGVGLGTSHRTLVVPDRSALAGLVALARREARAVGEEGTGGQHPEQAAVIGWWEQRADHPGTGAVLILTEACRLRWRLGAPPEHENQVAAWLTGLGVQDNGPSGLLDLARRVSAGHTLPGLLEMHDTDTRSWDYHRERAAAGHVWARPDGRAQAAFGLATRSDAAELYESLRLGDPLIALRESFTGTVVTGTVSHVDGRRLELWSPRLLCRLRPDSQVQGWLGGPQDVPQALDDSRPRLRTGRLSQVVVTPDRQLAITVADVMVRAGFFRVGDQLTLRPRAVDPRQQRNGRQLAQERYRSTRNWLAGGRPPARRREVPLDVVISAATD